MIENDELALELNKAKTEALNNKKYAQEYEQKLNDKVDELNNTLAIVKQQSTEIDSLKNEFKKSTDAYAELQAKHNELTAILEGSKKENEQLKQKVTTADNQINTAKEATNNMKKQMTSLINDFNIFA